MNLSDAKVVSFLTQDGSVCSCKNNSVVDSNYARCDNDCCNDCDCACEQ